MGITDSLEESSNDYDVNNPMFSYDAASAAAGVSNNKPKIRGKMWVLYINEKSQNWQSLCEGRKMVDIKDKIVWKYEYPEVVVNNYNE